jgi:hypothetical protein
MPDSVQQPKSVTDAVARYVTEGDKGTTWVYQWLTKTERNAVDQHLVAIDHPIAYQPGTNEHRFRQYVKELAVKGEPNAR